jgi:hypothetical protein
MATAYVHGYPSLAAFIASDKDQLTSIYPIFHRSSTRNLLYLEAELAELVARQETFDTQDLCGDFDRKEYTRSWAKLVNSDDPKHKEQLQLIYDIRKKTKEYRRCIYLHALFGYKPTWPRCMILLIY